VRAISSAAERLRHMERAGGSSPPLRTEDEPIGEEAGCEPVRSGFDSRRPPRQLGRVVMQLPVKQSPLASVVRSHQLARESGTQVLVAQWRERRAPNPKDAGSSPAGDTVV
jgi:hypothetical protein